MILTQALLNVQDEREKKDKKLTSMAGIGIYFDLDGTHGEVGKAVKPSSIALHARFLAFNRWLLKVMNRQVRCRIATLEQDAMLIETYKKLALFGYKGFGPLNPSMFSGMSFV